MNSKSVARTEVPQAPAASTPKAAPVVVPSRPSAARGENVPANTPPAVESLAGKFLRSFQVLLSATRLYQRNHPRIAESLELAEINLRAALQSSQQLEFRVEGGALTLLGQTDNVPLADPRGELHSLAVQLADAGVSTIHFLPRANLSELELLARAIDATSRVANQNRGQRGTTNRNWSAWLEQHKIAGLRVNPVAERRKEDTVLAILLGALPSSSPGTPHTPLETNRNELCEALNFLADAAPRWQAAQHESAADAGRLVQGDLFGASRQTVEILRRGLAIDPPRPGDTAEAYLARLYDAFIVDFLRTEYSAGRTRAMDIRRAVSELSRHGSRSGEETDRERRTEKFWAALPARERARVLASNEAWCVPVPVLRRYIEPLIAAYERKHAEASGREARGALADFARCVESEEEKARRATAAGLVELADLFDRLWPHPRFTETTRRVVNALIAETSPGITALLAAVTEIMARLALEHGAYGEFEQILDALAQAPRDAERETIEALSRRIVAQDRWLTLADTALANRSLDPALPKLLRRDPERLLDRLGLLLTSPDGADAFPAMARLVRGAGEPVLGALEAHLSEPGHQRIATAIKLLSAVQPERLAMALPHALPAWDWSLQNLAVTELARQSQPAVRSQIAEVFLSMLAEAHVYVMPAMLDQIALAGHASAAQRLVEIAAGKVEGARDQFIRIKAIEAIGQLRAETALPMLLETVRNRSGLTYLEPAGLRSAAEEALALIENRRGSAALRVVTGGEQGSSHFERPRRYVRVRLPSALTAKLEGPNQQAATISVIALGGALIETQRPLTTGEQLRIEIRAGMRHIATTSVVRNAGVRGYGIEFVHMTQDDREKLRRYLGKFLS